MTARDLTEPVADASEGHGTGQQLFEGWFAAAPDLAQLSYAARRLLAMAAALFLHQGAAGTSIRDITRACGLTPGALYNHFASKDDLLYVIVCHGHQSVENRIASALATVGADPKERTAAFVRAYVLGHLERPEMAQVVRREYLHLTGPRYEEIVGRRRRLRGQLDALLRDGADAGIFDLIDGPGGATRLAIMILDMCSRTSEWYDPRRAERPDTLAERYVTAALRLAGAG